MIAVVALLLALALPALSRVRRSGRIAQSSANARSLLQAITLYADANRELTPVTRDGEFYPASDESFRVSFPYWQIDQTWSGVIFGVLPYHTNRATYLSPGSPRLRTPGQDWPSSYHYSRSFAGDPSLWRPGSPPDPRLQRATRLSEVAFGSRKAMLWDREAAYLGAPPPRSADADIRVPIPIAFVDASVRLLAPADATRGVRNPLEPTTRRLDNTADGVLGVDFP